ADEGGGTPFSGVSMMVSTAGPRGPGEGPPGGGPRGGVTGSVLSPGGVASGSGVGTALGAGVPGADGTGGLPPPQSPAGRGRPAATKSTPAWAVPALAVTWAETAPLALPTRVTMTTAPPPSGPLNVEALNCKSPAVVTDSMSVKVTGLTPAPVIEPAPGPLGTM